MVGWGYLVLFLYLFCYTWDKVFGLLLYDIPLLLALSESNWRLKTSHVLYESFFENDHSWCELNQSTWILESSWLTISHLELLEHTLGHRGKYTLHPTPDFVPLQNPVYQSVKFLVSRWRKITCISESQLMIETIIFGLYSLMGFLLVGSVCTETLTLNSLSHIILLLFFR